MDTKTSDAEHLHTHSARVRTREGVRYEARVFGRPRSDGTWEGWLEFHPIDGAGPVLRTDRETSQPDRRAVVYWASGLEPIYIDGAFQRAK